MNSSIFSDEALQNIVAKTLSTVEIPDNKQGAFLTVADNFGVTAVVAIKVHDDWQIHAAVSRAWKDGNSLEYGVSVTGTF